MIQTLRGVRHLATAAMKHRVSEFHVPVPWGEIRGRIWGPDNGRPVLCIHGWSDNSGSFNNLIPLLPSDWRCLAIDLPGHGFSSHRPAGVFYGFPYYVADMRRVVEALQWNRFSIIGHSMGGNVAGMFSALYPEMVEALVLLDSYGFLPAHKEKINRNLRKGMDEMIEYEKKMTEWKEKIYTYEAAKERLKEANPSLSDQSVQILLERGVKQVDGGVVFSRDMRINFTNIARIDLDQSLCLLAQIKAKVLVLWASQGLLKIFPQPEDLFEGLQKALETRNTIVKVEGDHHIHLNNASVVAPIITDFLQSVTPQHTINQAAKL
ncbi:serine hydrolase-like protein [Pygocentrus nattereri]|uniref:AB hydrolase-1 domain-containing protein n=1 Tax=Pygocentrus nattereri TaxID=42514 RepID=A0A3B4EE86_PYGNA|nr:serine hydrolase-like protein [Pygocentrus nattereri]